MTESAKIVSPDYCLKIHTGKKGLKSLFSDWLALAENLIHPGPLHFPYWYAAFLNRPDTIDKHVVFITIYRGGNLAAIFPVGCRRYPRFNLVELSIPITDDLDIFPDAIVGVNEDHAVVFKFFLKVMRAHPGLKWDVLVVRNTLHESHISKCLDNNKRYLTMYQQTGFCNWVRTDLFDCQPPILSKNFRANLRKAKNQLNKTGTSAFEVVSDLPFVMEAFATFVDIESTGWKGKSRHGKQNYYAGSAMSLNKSKLSFYQDVVRSLSRNGHIEMYKLILNGKVISIQIGIVLKSTCYLLKIAYDEAHAKLSPGNLLLERVIQYHAQGNKISAINFISDYNWHNVWKPSRTYYRTYHCFNSTGRGSTYSIGKRLQSALLSLKSPTVKSVPGCQ